jgi:nucleotide-binding universal stress UspA family protein
MSVKIIAAYDATPHADDALALARQLASLLDAQVVIAHVHREAADAPAGRSEFLQRQSEALLARAVERLGDGVETRALGCTTTAMGLRDFAAREGALAIVFGSAHDGPSGQVHPGSAGRRLLQSAPCALAFAPSGWREAGRDSLSSIAVGVDDAEGETHRSADALAPTGLASDPADADLLLVGSRAGAELGKVMTGPAAEQAIQAATVPVLVLPAGVRLVPGEPLRVPTAA